MFSFHFRRVGISFEYEFSWCVFVRATLHMRREEIQLDVTECIISLMIRSICSGHFYAHHQELATICVLLAPMVCSAWLLVVGGQVQSSRLCVRNEGCCMTAVVQHPSSWTQAPDDEHRSVRNILSVS